MGVQEVQGNSGIPAYQSRKKTGTAEGFQESLIQNLKNRDQEVKAGTDIEPEAKKKTEQSGIGRLGVQTGIRLNAAASQNALRAVEVRHMSYEESDHVKIAVTEGYTLKGKREGSEEPKVYVEAKYDDGRLEAYQVEMTRVSENTEHTIERFALETMQET